MDEVMEQYTARNARWVEELEQLIAYIGHRFGRREMQERARDYLIGLLSPIERKNGW